MDNFMQISVEEFYMLFGQKNIEVYILQKQVEELKKKLQEALAKEI